MLHVRWVPVVKAVQTRTAPKLVNLHRPAFILGIYLIIPRVTILG